MKEIIANFRFNKAGQGCFYTGILTNEKSNSSFSIAYDCGTHSTKQYLINEINKFQVELRLRTGGILNLLIISHFDEDHVNELARLINGVSEIDYIVLPYLTPAERLVVFLNSSEDDENGDYISFITDPVAFLLESGIKINHILYIVGDEGTEDNVNTSNELTPVIDNDIFRVDYKELKATDAKENKVDDRVSFLKDKGRFKIASIWEFYFYNKPVDDALLTTLYALIESSFPKLNFKDLTKDSLSVILSKSNLNELKKVYRSSLKIPNLNPTSLIVYHAPCYNYLGDDNYYYFGRRFRSFTINYRRSPMTGKFLSTLLTGDIYTVGLVFPTYITTNADKIIILQMPHHGSRTNWNFAVLTALIKHRIYAVINFGLGNKHKHPKQEVIDDINTVGWRIKLNHQLKSFKYAARLRYR